MAFFGNHLNCDSIGVHVDHCIVYDEDDVKDIVDKYEEKIAELEARIAELESED